MNTLTATNIVKLENSVAKKTFLFIHRQLFYKATILRSILEGFAQSLKRWQTPSVKIQEGGEATPY